MFSFCVVEVALYFLVRVFCRDYGRLGTFEISVVACYELYYWVVPVGVGVASFCV